MTRSFAQPAHVSAFAAGSIVARGRLVTIESDGTLIVAGGDHETTRFSCDYLWVDRAAEAPLVEGCQVLYVPPSEDSERGCILGVIGRYIKNTDESKASTETVAQPALERVIDIQAGERLSLVCGDSSIVLSGDGTVAIRGARIVSRSKGINRIKGASVQIN